MFRVIGLSGKAGVGKDFAAQWIHERVGKSMIVAFADQLKINTMMKHSLYFEDVFVNKNKHTRQLLQKTGTEEGRNVYGKDVWLRYMRAWMSLHNQRMGIETFIITDCRFPNEVEFVKSFPKSLTIRIEAPERNKQRLMDEKSYTETDVTKHSSECALDDKEDMFDYILKNDPDDCLHTQLYKLLPTLNCSPFPPVSYYNTV